MLRLTAPEPQRRKVSVAKCGNRCLLLSDEVVGSKNGEGGCRCKCRWENLRLEVEVGIEEYKVLLKRLNHSRDNSV